MKRKSKRGPREAGYRLVEALDVVRARAGTVIRIAALAVVALGVVTEESRRSQPKSKKRSPARDEPQRPSRRSRRGAA